MTFWLLQSEIFAVRQATLTCLISNSQHLSAIQLSRKYDNNFLNDKEFIFQLLFAFSIEEETELQGQFLEYVNLIMKKWKNQSFLREYLILFQSVSSLDGSELFNEYVKSQVENLKESDYLTMTLRGLFHTEIEIRKQSASIINQILKESGVLPLEKENDHQYEIGNVFDAFIFSSQQVRELQKQRKEEIFNYETSRKNVINYLVIMFQ